MFSQREYNDKVSGASSNVLRNSDPLTKFDLTSEKTFDLLKRGICHHAYINFGNTFSNGPIPVQDKSIIDRITLNRVFQADKNRNYGSLERVFR